MASVLPRKQHQNLEVNITGQNTLDWDGLQKQYPKRLNNTNVAPTPCWEKQQRRDDYKA
jgi:hypothetical protein